MTAPLRRVCHAPESLRLRGESGFMLKALAQGVVWTLEHLERLETARA